MITIEDFTLLTEGFVDAAEGTISRCPRCGRNGIVKNPEGSVPYCVHAEESELLCDGMFTEPTDCCELEKL